MRTGARDASPRGPPLRSLLQGAVPSRMRASLVLSPGGFPPRVCPREPTAQWGRQAWTQAADGCSDGPGEGHQGRTEEAGSRPPQGREGSALTPSTGGNEGRVGTQGAWPGASQRPCAAGAQKSWPRDAQSLGDRALCLCGAGAPWGLCAQTPAECGRSAKPITDAHSCSPHSGRSECCYCPHVQSGKLRHSVVSSSY